MFLECSLNVDARAHFVTTMTLCAVCSDPTAGACPAPRDGRPRQLHRGAGPEGPCGRQAGAHPRGAAPVQPQLPPGVPGEEERHSTLLRMVFTQH
eukprot:600092-Pyramimonas_sp.AAC.1